MTRSKATRRLGRWLLLLLAAWLLFLGWQIVEYSTRTFTGGADAAIVLGAAVRGPRPSPVFEGRLRHAVQLHRSGRVRKLLLTGGLGEGTRTSEASAGRHYALAHGVPPQDILIEERSRTTRGNLLEAKSLMARARLRSALLVSDPLHLPRALRMAKDLGMDAQPSPTPFSRYRSWHTKASFLLRELYFTNHYLLTGQ